MGRRLTSNMSRSFSSRAYRAFAFSSDARKSRSARAGSLCTREAKRASPIKKAPVIRRGLPAVHGELFALKRRIKPEKIPVAAFHGPVHLPLAALHAALQEWSSQGE